MLCFKNNPNPTKYGVPNVAIYGYDRNVIMEYKISKSVFPYNMAMYGNELLILYIHHRHSSRVLIIIVDDSRQRLLLYYIIIIISSILIIMIIL